MIAEKHGHSQEGNNKATTAHTHSVFATHAAHMQAQGQGGGGGRSKSSGHLRDAREKDARLHVGARAMPQNAAFPRSKSCSDDAQERDTDSLSHTHQGSDVQSTNSRLLSSSTTETGRNSPTRLKNSHTQGMPDASKRNTDMKSTNVDAEMHAGPVSNVVKDAKDAIKGSQPKTTSTQIVRAGKRADINSILGAGGRRLQEKHDANHGKHQDENLKSRTHW